MLTSLSAYSSPAIAQTASAEAATTDAQKTTNRENDDIVVTAARAMSANGALGSRPVLDTPYSINIVSAKEIEDRQAFSMSQVFAKDASIGLYTGSAYNAYSNRLTIRGLSLDLGNSYRLNGQPFYGWGSVLPIEDMQEIQVLKGASGFMYGLVAPGGVINFVTKKPTETPLASVDAGFRSDSVFTGHVDLGGRIGKNDMFGYRTNLSFETGHTYTNSDVDRQAATLAIDAKISDSLLWSAEVLYQRFYIRRPVPTNFAINTPTYLTTVVPEGIDSRNLQVSPQAFSDDHFFYGTTGLSWRFAPNWSASLAASAMRINRVYPTDYFYILNQAGDYKDRTFPGRYRLSYRHLQLLVNGTLNTGPVEHQIVLGGVIQQQQAYTDTNNVFTVSLAAAPLSNLYNPTAPNWTVPNEGAQYRYTYVLQKAAFISDTLTWGKFSLLAGIRYNDYTTRQWNGPGQPPALNYQKPVTTPSLAIMFKPIPGATVYASYAEALEQGVVVNSLYNNYNQVYPPLKSKQYEAGVKVQRPLFDATVALFQMDRAAYVADIANNYVPAGLQRYRGIDSAFALRPASGLELFTSFVLLDGVYKNTDIAYLRGRRAAGATPFSAAFGASYDVAAVPGLTFNLLGKYYAKTPVYVTAATQVTISTRDSTVFSGGLGYKTKVGTTPITFRAQMENIFNVKYWLPAANALSIGVPRMVSLNVKVDL
ncbi:TonB-dependent receptor [Sphingomonas sp. CL5.1]|uniref:TonB-dependent siderophore receptor n=1 Tax=Sphingomonas sp. CL5.1 TaxID=2653203 RepID=UPI0015843A80|nr:TonB-dependent receptor [Sphingomonas sp. CL5.1]QKR99911.1 TonB-dependent receptor [Sphingomonas sp. CL5.1]